MLRAPLLLVFLLGLLSAQETRSLPVPKKPTGTFRISILGCLRQNQPAPALARYAQHDADLVLWVGDNMYADTDDPAAIARCYQQLAKLPDFERVHTMAPQMVAWDDHDFGDNNRGGDYPIKFESKELFRRFWGLEDVVPEDRAGVYYSRTFAVGTRRLQVILLDVRYERGKPDGTADMLGEAQWQWLGEQLEAQVDLRLVVSGTQILLPKESGSETWDEYPKSRQRLLELLRARRSERTLFLTGDQHYGEVARQRGALGYDLVELQFAGVNQTEKPEFHPLRVTPCATALHSDAMLDIRFERDQYEVPHSLFRVFDAATGQVELTYRVNFDELELPEVRPETGRPDGSGAPKALRSQPLDRTAQPR